MATAAFNVTRGTTIIASGDATASLTEGTEYTLQRDTPSADYAFVRIVCTRLTGMGTTSGGGRQSHENFTVYISSTDITSGVTFTRLGTSNDCRVNWEVVEYIGEASGANELIVRGVGTVSGTGTPLTGTTLTNISDNGDVVVFITGQASDDTSYADWHYALWVSSLVANGSDWDPRFNRETSVTNETAYVSYAVVEFTGSNWRAVQRNETVVEASEWDAATPDVSTTDPLDTSLLDASRAFCHVQYATDNDATGDDDAGDIIRLTDGSTTNLTIRNRRIDGTRRKVVWVVENTASTSDVEMIVEHREFYDTGGGTEERVVTDTGLNAVRALAETSIMGECASTDGASRNAPHGSNVGRVTGTAATPTTEWRMSDNAEEQWIAYDVVQWPRDSGGPQTVSATVQDSFTFSDEQDRDVAADRALADSLVFDESIWRSKHHLDTLQDNLIGLWAFDGGDSFDSGLWFDYSLGYIGEQQQRDVVVDRLVQDVIPTVDGLFAVLEGVVFKVRYVRDAITTFADDIDTHGSFNRGGFNINIQPDAPWDALLQKVFFDSGRTFDDATPWLFDVGEWYDNLVRGIIRETRELADSLTSTDQIKHAQDLIRELEDLAGLSEEIARDVWGDRSQADSFTFEDDLNYGVTQAGAEGEFVDRTQSDAFTFSDNLDERKHLLRQRADDLTFYEQVKRQITGSDRFIFEDYVVRDFWGDRLLQDTFVFDEFLKTGKVIKQLQDVFTFVDNLTTPADIYDRALADTFTFSDNLLAYKMAVYALQDVFTFVDSQTRDGIFTRGASDANVLAEQIVSDVFADRALQDVFTFTDALVADVIIRLRQISDSLPFSDSQLRDLVLDRLLQQVSAFDDNLDATVTEAGAVTPAVFEHWRLYLHHKWAMRRRLWRRWMDRDEYPPQG